MPVSFNSPARNLFLLGSSGGTVVTNFFKTILDSSTDGVFSTKEISYNYSEQNYILSGSASDINSVEFGWIEKRDYDAETDPNNPTSSVSFATKIQSTTSSNLILNDIELDSNNNIIACGITGSTPWVIKYSNAGVVDWQSTSNSGDVEYKNITSDSNNEYYASGNTTTSNSTTFIEKFDVDGSPLWGKSAAVLGRDIQLNGIAVNDRSEVVSVGWLEDDSRTKGYIVKVDTSSGTVLWDKTLVSSERSGLIYTSTVCEDVFIDTQDNIYVVGKLYNANDSSTKSFIIKLSPEGNIVWQKETDENIEYYRVKADGDTGQVVTFGRYYDSVGNDQGGLITKYTRGGNISWRRTIFSSYNGSDFFGSDTVNGGGVALDADASFYYVLYTDDEKDGLNGTPTSYTFGKVSTSGNGLGGFEYDDGESETVYYDILNATERIGRLSDGSVRNDTSDLVAYPFSANKIVFDDFATPVANKKRQMDSADSFEYSGPAIIPETMPVELITNGDFNSSNVTGWSVSSANADMRYYYTDTYNGTITLIMFNYAVTGSFYQSFTTEIGKPYKVIFDQGGGPVIKIFDGSGVSGTTLQTITTTSLWPGNTTTLTSETGTFVATSTTSTFAVFDIGPGEAYAIDNISVQKIDSPVDSPAIRVADFQELNLLGYADIPETMPVELIINGDFNSEDPWGNAMPSGWSLSGGSLLFYYTANQNGTISLAMFNFGVATSFYQSFTTEIGRPYKVSLAQNGGPVIKIFDGSGVSGTTLQTITTTNSGNYEPGETGTFVATSTTSTFAVFDIGPGESYIIDNISVQKDVLGPELITNGGFENDNLNGWTLDQNGGNVLVNYSSGYTGSRSVSLQNINALTNPSNPGDPKFYQSFATEPGKTYRITLQQAGSPTFTIFDGSGLSGTTLKTMTTRTTGSSAVDEEAYFKAASTTSTIAIASFGSSSYLMDDISVKETPITLLWGDQSGKDNSVVVLGATHNADGYWEFDGTDDKIVGPPCNTILSADSSIELWVNFDDVTTRQTIISGYNSTPNTDPNRWDFEMNAGSFRGGFHDNGFFTSSTAISIGGWHHVMLVLNSSTNTLKFYLNGVEDLSQSCSNFNFGGPDVDLGIGDRNESSIGPMDGRIGEVRVYPRALAAAQVYQNYNATKTKYIYEAPDTAPKISDSAIVYDSNLLLNYDFGNRATYDPAATVNVGENRYTSSFNLTKFSDGTPNGVLTDWSWLGATTPTITRHAAIAPDGSKTAALLPGSSATIYQSIVNDGDFTISAWVKTVDGSSQSFQQYVYLLNTGGEIVSAIHTATGDWQRFTLSGVATSEWGAPAGEYHRYYPFASAADLYVWGPQVELKSSANTYVPTYGTAAIPGVSRLPNTVKNLSSSSYPGILEGATFNSNGYMELDSNYSVINAGPANLYSGNNVSFEMWFYPETTAEAISKSMMLTANYEGGYQPGTVILRYDKDPFGTRRMFIAQVKIGSTDEFWQHSTRYPRDTWHHVVWTWNNGTMKLYVNGSEKTLDTNTGGPTSGAILNGSGNIYIGENYTYGGSIIGDYGQLRIYTKTLSATEVLQNFNATRGKYGV